MPQLSTGWFTLGMNMPDDSYEHEFTSILIFMFKYLDVDSLLKKSESQHESPEDGCPFGPLTQRLLQALVEVSTL